MNPRGTTSAIIAEHGVEAARHRLALFVLPLWPCMCDILNIVHDAKVLGIVKRKRELVKDLHLAKAKADSQGCLLNLGGRQSRIAVLNDKSSESVVKIERAVPVSGRFKGQSLDTWPLCDLDARPD